MRKFLPPVVAVLVAIVVATGAVLVAPPRDANGLSWRYYTILNGSRADTQVDGLVYLYPWLGDDWPQRRIATSYSYAYSNAAGLSCVTTIYVKAYCVGWRAVGPVSEFTVAMGVELNWRAVDPGVKDEGWYSPEFRVYCSPIQAVAVSLNPISCGLLSQTTSTITLGYYFSTTTQANKFIPTTTVWWRSYIICRKYDGYCFEPFTVPAG
jgi:hypothetical protein